MSSPWIWSWGATEEVAMIKLYAVATSRKCCSIVTGIKNMAGSLVPMPFQKKITLLRVIPTMTCRVVVVRWGLSG